MPRKATKTEKPALHFLERPAGGARLQNVPEVRAALNPKEFFTETQAQSSTTLNSWVNPQFDTSVAAAAPLRRGRRKCQSATTSILDRCSHLSRKNSVCKFPSLSFQTRSRDQSHQPKSTRTARKAAESTVVSGNQPPGSCQIKKAVSCAQNLDAPKRQSASVSKRKAEKSADGATSSSSRCADRAETPSTGGETRRVRAAGASTIYTTRKAAELTSASDTGNQPRGSCQLKKAVSCAQNLDTPKRQSASVSKRKDERSLDGAASSDRCADRAETPSTGGGVRADGASTPASSEFSDIGPAPDVDTPKLIPEGSSCPSSPSVHLLLARSCTPPCNRPPDILVADTPERDYGVKVTWRKRKGLMSMLKERGLLSDSDVLIHS